MINYPDRKRLPFGRKYVMLGLGHIDQVKMNGASKKDIEQYRERLSAFNRWEEEYHSTLPLEQVLRAVFELWAILPEEARERIRESKKDDYLNIVMMQKALSVLRCDE